MSQVEKQRERLIALLKELFQLDQPDLDFGFYRIMHAKAGQVSKFLEEDLLGIIREAFGEADDARIAEAKAAYDAARKQAVDYGAPDPDATEPVKKAKAAWQAAKDSGSNEGDVYDHLYRFFERYYDSGDFMSRRYFARETDGKAAPYAVPYDGREIYLHWANRDQYYIKTSEYLTNFTFDPTQAKEFKEHHGELFGEKPLKVHCRVVSASEGEHNNVKASEQTERYFIIHEDEPVKVEIGETDAPELVIQFEYRADPEKTGQDGTWRKRRLAEAVAAVETALPGIDQAEDYVKALLMPAPTEAEKDRTLLAKYLAQYTGRNTMDYFIHKDLGGFLKRELDFYIKNEVMRLDDIEAADVPRVETYLAKIKVLRRIAQHLIDFLSQLEDFQKKLWLKKKFVLETNYCVTLDLVPEELLSEVSENELQASEWERNLTKHQREEYGGCFTVAFLKENPSLVLDTANFNSEFKDRLIASIDFDENPIHGVLINGENSQAARLCKPELNDSIRMVYIDPPFNLGENGDYLYKTNYKDSTWAAMLYERIGLFHSLLKSDGVFYTRCDDHGNHLVRLIKDEIFGPENFQCELSVQRIRKNVTGQGKISMPLANDSLFLYYKSADSFLVDPYLKLETERKAYWRRIDDSAGFRNPPEREIFGRVFMPYKRDAHFKYSQASIERMIEEGRIRLKCRSCSFEHYQGKWVGCPECGEDNAVPQYKVEATDKKILDTNWMDISGYSSKWGFSTENSEALLQRSIEVGSSPGDLVADFFAGSGTTCAVSEKLGRRWFGVEMGEQFELVLKHRMKRVLSESKKTGIFKYSLIESYEDTLNNLDPGEFDLASLENTNFRREFALKYWMDFATKGSPSILNVEFFSDPTSYRLNVKKPGTDEYVEKSVDLIETFNWLIGLHVEHLDRWRSYDAEFKREKDEELPKDSSTRLMIDGNLKETDDGAWRFRKIEGYTLYTLGDQSDPERALVVWRKLTDDLERDNLMLDEWFKKYRLSAQDTEFDVIYVNGSNNLPNLRQEEETWKVRLIEEAFHKAMWDVEG